MADVIDWGHSKPPPTAACFSLEQVSISPSSASASAPATLFPFSPTSYGGGTSGFSSAGSRSSWSSDSCSEVPQQLPRLAVLCLNEFYILVHRARVLLEYCAQASRLWLILRGSQIARRFHEVDLEISTLLEVIPLDEFHLAADVRDHVVLLRRHVGNSSARGVFLDSKDESLKKQILCFLKEFESGKAPNPADLKSTFVDQIGISTAGDFEFEIGFLLEEQICIREEDARADLGIVAGVIALARYCHFLGLREEERHENKKKKKILPAVNYFSVPRDFCCPISLDLMRDPVVVSTGHTYDRNSISNYLDAGNHIFPNSGEILDSAALVPNRALRSLISQWCASKGIPYDNEKTNDAASMAAVEPNRAAARIIMGNLSNGDEQSKAAATAALLILSKIGKENRTVIADTS